MLRAFPSLVMLAALSAACASTTPAAAPQQASRSVRPASYGAPGDVSTRAAVVNTAIDMVGVPYRYGGKSPRGFDCSGLVVYSYAKAGYSGLPHSASRLADLSRPVGLEDLEPGDLMLFELTGKKASHVGIYVGDRRFVHAPSSGGRVEIVDFDHVYWRDHIGKAGRLIAASEEVARAD